MAVGQSQECQVISEVRSSSCDLRVHCMIFIPTSVEVLMVQSATRVKRKMVTGNIPDTETDSGVDLKVIRKLSFKDDSAGHSQVTALCQ